MVKSNYYMVNPGGMEPTGRLIAESNSNTWFWGELMRGLIMTFGKYFCEPKLWSPILAVDVDADYDAVCVAALHSAYHISLAGRTVWALKPTPTLSVISLSFLSTLIH